MWDGRVALTTGGLETPLGAALPRGLSGPLAAQSLLPILARVEMRGHGSDELAAIPDSESGRVYDAVVSRLRAIPLYDTLFAAAYPGLVPESLTIAHVANAIAAFITARWSTGGTPFDEYLAGDSLALDASAHRGAELFFGHARCGECHRGPLLTDQQFHNTGVPALGPGLLSGGPDVGRAGVSGQPSDRYLFRTPPLRNATITAPYMHNGSFGTLDAVVAHYRSPRESLAHFDTTLVDPRLRHSVDLSPTRVQEILSTLDPRLQQGIALSDQDLADLVAFLRTLTDPASGVLLRDVPASVPSGLPVFDQ
jgi:cytochrome c peroxidase